MGASTSYTSSSSETSESSGPATVSNISAGPHMVSAESEPTPPSRMHYQPYHQYAQQQQNIPMMGAAASRVPPHVLSSSMQVPKRPDPDMKSYHGRGFPQGNVKPPQGNHCRNPVPSLRNTVSNNPDPSSFTQTSII